MEVDYISLSLTVKKNGGLGSGLATVRADIEDSNVAMKEDSMRENKISSQAPEGMEAVGIKDKRTTIMKRRNQKKKDLLLPETTMVAREGCEEGGLRTASLCITEQLAR